MIDFDALHRLATQRHGATSLSTAYLPQVLDAPDLMARDDAFYLSAMTRRIFRAGLRYKLVDNKWPAFEAAFFNFDPDKLVLMPDAMLESRMQDTRLIRHWGKMKAIRVNAQMVLDIRQQYGSVGQWLAQWPADDTIGLWLLMRRQGKQLGGNSAPAFLRMVGKDTWYPTTDVVAALSAHGIIDKAPTSQRDLKAAQAAFNTWQQQSGWPQAHISQMLAYTVG